MAPRILRGRTGLTLVEMAVSLSIVVLAVFGMTSILVHSSRSSDRTTSQSGIDSGVAMAGERVAGYLMEARVVTIDTNGMGLTYKYPAPDPGTGGEVYSSDPKAAETGNRRLYVSNGELLCSDEPDRPILTDIPDTDPETHAALRVFSAGLNSHEIVVRLASEKTSSREHTQYSAETIRVQPRNML